MPAADDLYPRYMRADDTWRAHRDVCPLCRTGAHCPTGVPLAERFERLQDAYLGRGRST
ncbi:hypothetical protein [Streptomyces sp. NPDC088726]|uniref:hypothetical protein n=1 Tax=Streptomyces sp. NPDC088726 TaxID=3365874 RepID=UPI0038128DE8